MEIIDVGAGHACFLLNMCYKRGAAKLRYYNTLTCKLSYQRHDPKVETSLNDTIRESLKSRKAWFYYKKPFDFIKFIESYGRVLAKSL